MKASKEIEQLAIEFTDKQAVARLQTCGVQSINGVWWVNTMNTTDGDVQWEVKYLHLRGIIERHGLHYNLVRIKGMNDGEESIQHTT